MRPNIPYCIESIRKNLTNEEALRHLNMLEDEFHRLEGVIEALVKSERSKISR